LIIQKEEEEKKKSSKTDKSTNIQYIT
jgi:hypothetical protein